MSSLTSVFSLIQQIFIECLLCAVQCVRDKMVVQVLLSAHGAVLWRKHSKKKQNTFLCKSWRSVRKANKDWSREWGTRQHKGCCWWWYWVFMTGRSAGPVWGHSISCECWPVGQQGPGWEWRSDMQMVWTGEWLLAQDLLKNEIVKLGGKFKTDDAHERKCLSVYTMCFIWLNAHVLWRLK